MLFVELFKSGDLKVCGGLGERGKLIRFRRYRPSQIHMAPPTYQEKRSRLVAARRAERFKRLTNEELKQLIEEHDVALPEGANRYAIMEYLVHSVAPMPAGTQWHTHTHTRLTHTHTPAPNISVSFCN